VTERPTSDAFSDLHPKLAGFGRDWDGIRSDLVRLDAQNKSRRARARVLVWLLIPAALLGPVMLGLLLNLLGVGVSLNASLFVSVVLTIVTYGSLRAWKSRPFDQAGDLIRDAVFRYFGLTHERKPTSEMARRFSQIGLLPRAKSVVCRDRLVGVIKGVEFEFCEVRLIASKNDQRRPFYKGLLFALKRRTAVAGTTVVLGRRRMGFFIAFDDWIRGRTLTPTGHAPFDQEFKDFSDLPLLEMKRHLNAHVRDDLLAVTDKGRRHVAAALIDDTLMLAVRDDRDLFELANETVDLADERNVLDVAFGLAVFVHLAEVFSEERTPEPH
jgi:hypothetical protein